ncbi:queuosine precursor transporter [Saccharibacillus endophyticus]|uniref:Probable queuosine precursor transporter n=1 Tax=Saccharibacillus endophyticus TaxID=2060666 RepID=A0ABQ1ZST2_9BACL|nr:queuosine precursor transporter [Saccharibacillus endophyticus]GGH75421.1 hypothetical protein GCM10007362_16470 [Saccharibacillus endophyticus]
MFNFTWGVFFVLVNFAFFLLCFKFFGKKGLYAWVGVATVVANLQVAKTIDMLGITMTLGNTMYVSIYMATDLLNERYGVKAARKAVWFGFFMLIMTTVIMQMVLAFRPSEVDFAQEPLQALFGLLPRLALGSLAAYLVSQLLDVYLYAGIRRRFASANQLWIRNNGSGVVSSFIDTLIFCAIAFTGPEYGGFSVWIQLFISTYLFKFILTAAGTPVLYWARGFKVPAVEADSGLPTIASK